VGEQLAERGLLGGVVAVDEPAALAVDHRAARLRDGTISPA
jgi:hypothetical protein